VNSPYSPLKVFHHRDKIDVLKSGGQPLPTHVEVIPSDLCNHNCGFCSYRAEGYSSNQLFGVIRDDGTKNNNPNRMISYGKMREIIEDCAIMGVKSIQVTGGGEPTVHPQHGQIFKDILSQGMELALVTNGGKLSDDVIETLTRANWVRISIDAGLASTYASVREISESAFARTWANVRKLVEANKRNHSKCRIGIGFVVTKENWKEVTLATKLARDAGVNNIRISAFFQNDGAKYYESFHEEAVEECRKAAEMSWPGFSVFNNFGDRVEDLREESPDYSFCGYQHFTTYIGADLNVYRCCVLAYNERGIVGSIKDQRFAELWASEAKKQNFSEFDARGCERCMFNNRNRTILYAIESNPADVNFV